MVNKSPVSIYIVSGAESHRIGRLLDSVAGWAAEIVVVLNEEVRDGTEEICLRSGALVFREPWKGFVAQKNSAVAKTNQPWVLNLDADEIVSPELALEIQGVVRARGTFTIYEFPRCTLYCGRWIRHGDWYPDRVRRLSRREGTLWVGEEPHAALQIEESVGRLKSDLLHHTSETINHQVAKTVRYADAFAAHSARDQRRVTGFDLLFRPVFRFVRGYFFKMGFLDGWQGFAIAWMTAFYTFLRYVRVREDLENGSNPK